MGDRERGRGRGADINKPAWLVARERSENGPSGSSGDVDRNLDDRYSDRGSRERDRNGGSIERDQFGRVGRGAGGGGDHGRDRDYRGGGGRSREDGGGDFRGERGDGRRHRDDPYWRGGGRRGDRDNRDRRSRSERVGGNRSGIYFYSYEEERAWLDERRRKRHARKSLFDVEPTPEQAAMDEARAALEKDHLLRTGGMTAAATFYGGSTHDDNGGSRSVQPQQTRHARRLYVGNIPDLSEQEVHDFFRDAIKTALVIDSNTPLSHRSQYVDSDPLISVYINRERRFAFLEFKTMDICTACLAFDGIDVMGRGKVKVKRPNDYNPSLAPSPNSASLPKLDTSRLGIVSMSVPDGPNKIFIGGLPYHLTESQVLELLSAFGQVRAFHLVKSDPSAVTSKGYCFVEYSDPNVTQIAVMGLNGMDMGGGKQLSARMAASRGAADVMDSSSMMTMGPPVAAPPVGAAPVVDGVDVDALLQAALGGGGVGLPGMTPTSITNTMGTAILQQPSAVGQLGVNQMSSLQQNAASQQQPLDPLAVANAAASALEAAFGGGGAPAVQSMQAVAAPAVTSSQQVSENANSTIETTNLVPTRILVLHNMVMDEDLATKEDHTMLEEEIREEAGKYGKLLSIKIPRPTDGHASSAIKKVFLEYSSFGDAANAEKELKGRAFGPNIVETSYFSEDNYLRNHLF